MGYVIGEIFIYLGVICKHKFKLLIFNFRFYKSNNLKSHLLTHEKEKKLICSVEGCEKKFKRQKALAVHLVS